MRAAGRPLEGELPVQKRYVQAPDEDDHFEVAEDVRRDGEAPATEALPLHGAGPHVAQHDRKDRETGWNGDHDDSGRARRATEAIQ